MEISSAFILQFLGAVSTAGVVLFGLSSWLGKLWASRILAGEQAKYAEALHEATGRYDQQLEIAKAAINRYSESQFERYGALWQSLCELRAASDDLWETASPEKVRKFAKQVRDTRLSVNKSALILTEEHYDGLLSALDSFDQFNLGKINLVRLRSHPAELSYNEYSVREAIDRNGRVRDEYVKKLEVLRVHLKRQIGGVL
jgi:hypothetical protein